MLRRSRWRSWSGSTVRCGPCFPLTCLHHTCPVYVSTAGSFRTCGFSVRALPTTVCVVPCLNLCLYSPTPAVHLCHWLVYFGNVTLECSIAKREREGRDGNRERGREGHKDGERKEKRETEGVRERETQTEMGSRSIYLRTEVKSEDSLSSYFWVGWGSAAPSGIIL